jgi:hypothetical protein
MSQADKIVKSGELPAKLDGAAEEVSELCQQGWSHLENEEIPEETRALLQEKADNHGLHAYRYEELDDGSVVAIYANDPNGDVKFKAFDSMEEASKWSPRDEREQVAADDD